MSTLEAQGRAASTRSGFAFSPGRPRASHSAWATGVLVALVGLLVGCCLTSVGIGMVAISPGQVLAILASRVHIALP